MRARLWQLFTERAMLWSIRQCFKARGSIDIFDNAIVYTLPLKPGMADQLRELCVDAGLSVSDDFGDEPAEPLPN